MSVKLGAGFQTMIRGHCKKVEVEIEEVKIECTPHLFELGGPDLILGIEWLKTLGDTIINWNKHIIIFLEGGKWLTLQGLRSKVDKEEALQSLLSRSRGKNEGVL